MRHILVTDKQNHDQTLGVYETLKEVGNRLGVTQSCVCNAIKLNRLINHRYEVTDEEVEHGKINKGIP